MPEDEPGGEADAPGRAPDAAGRPSAPAAGAAEDLKVKRFPAYLISIILVFLAPGLALLARLWKRLPKAPLLASFAAIAVIGWAWSWTVSYNGWWSFGPKYMLGANVVPYLPVEEALFYPLGGLLSILVYLSLYSGKPGAKPGRPAAYWAYLAAGSLFFAALTWVAREHGPYYLYSQFVVYNGACCALLAPWTAREMDLRAMSVPVVLLGLAGFAWDYVGFTYGWWAFHATVHINISVVPIDDFNFFLFAPPSAISIYHVACRALGAEPLAREG